MYRMITFDLLSKNKYMNVIATLAHLAGEKQAIPYLNVTMSHVDINYQHKNMAVCVCVCYRDRKGRLW